MKRVFASVVLAIGLASGASAQNDLPAAEPGTSEEVGRGARIVRGGNDASYGGGGYEQRGTYRGGYGREKDERTGADRGNYGKGFYVGYYTGLDLGQDTKALARRLDVVDAGNARSHAGGVAGLKFGETLKDSFGQAAVYTDVELDLFYNGFSQASSNGDPRLRTDVDSFVYMANFLLRFDAAAVQPYLGMGIGGYAANVPVQAGGGSLESDEVGGFAWAFILGGDIYLSQKASIFMEYKWLNFQNGFACNGGIIDVGTLGGKDVRFGQNILTLGLRLHF